MSFESTKRVLMLILLLCFVPVELSQLVCMAAFARCIEVSLTWWLEINFCTSGFPDSEQHWLGLMEKLEQ